MKPVQDSRIRFETKTPFALELDRRVDAYFEGRSRRGGVGMLAKTLLIFAWLIGGYAALFAFAGSWPLIVVFGLSCGLACAGLGMAVQHDGGHLVYSKHRRLNRASATVLDLLGASSYVWRVKHGVVHHTYTNIEGIDDDIDATPFARLAPTQPHRRYHRLQAFYMWPLYAFLAIKWLVFDDFAALARGHIGGHPLRWPRGLDLAVFVLGKLVHLTWALLIPLAVLGLAKGLVFYAALSAACGVTLAVVFQLAHCVEEAEFIQPPPGTRVDFTAHQLATTVDFARGNRLLSWYIGGLNFQAVHHLFPRVCHRHYPALSKIVERTAAEFGIRYRINETLAGALGSHYRWLQRMGRGERAAAQASG